MKLRAFSLLELSIVFVVIGILVSGISAGIDLYQDFRLATARSLTLNSRVGRIEDLSLWVETSSDKSFTKTNPSQGEFIGEWRDINPLNNNKAKFIQNTQNYKPKYIKIGIGGIPSLEFNPLKTAENVTFLNLNNNYVDINTNNTIFIVFNPYLLGGMLLVSSNSSNYDYRILIQSQIEGATYPSASSKKIRYSLTNLQNTTAIEIDKDTAFSSNDVMENNAQIVGLKRDFNLNKYSIKLNNSVKYTTKTMEDSNIINSNLTIGMLNASGSDKRQFSGQISEIIIFNKALSDKEYEDVESYLKIKYQIKF